jgi:parvulin-like peptidyl-prolyl isomerase
MPYFLDGHPVPEDLIGQAEQWLRRDPRWQSIPDPGVRAAQLRGAAAQAAIERMLVERAAAQDPRAIEPELIDREIARQRQQASGLRTIFEDPQVRTVLEFQLRTQRTTREMVAGAAKPSPEDVETFYNSQRENFLKPPAYRAAYIVKHVNELQTEEQAEAGIEVALAELERGEPFAEVAKRHSDCKDNGGDLGEFPVGHMVQEFEDAIRVLEPGQRTGVFTTPFGFHIAELRAKIPAAPAGFDEVRADIERVLTTMNKHQVYLRALAELRSRADIRYVPD